MIPYLLTEGFRKLLWAILRVENEQVNNFEAYREQKVVKLDSEINLFT